MLIAAGCGSSSEPKESTIEKWVPKDESSESVIKKFAADGFYTAGKVKLAESVKQVKFGYEYYKKDKLVSDEEKTSVGTEDGSTKGIASINVKEGELTTYYDNDGKNEGIGGAGVLKGYERGKFTAFGGLQDGKKKIKIGKKVYLAAVAQGKKAIVSDPDVMAKDKSTMKGQAKTWLIYAVFDKKSNKEDK